MRKLLITALLAGVAAPALAAPVDRDAARAERQQAREERQTAREERQQAREEQAVPVPVAVERAVEVRAHDVEVRARDNDGPARAVAVGRADRDSVETIRAARQIERNERIEERAQLREERGDAASQTERSIRINDRQQIRDDRREAIRANRDLRQSERAVPNVLRPRVPVVSNTPRIGTQPPLRAEPRRSAPVNWSQHWRKDRRYDWWNWRNRHRSLFNLGFYYDPFGWGYQRYGIGWRMWPSYYHSSFWLNDPWQYRLPYAPPGYRWVRYYDDAVLVDTWDGRVVDVIYNFFW